VADDLRLPGQAVVDPSGDRVRTLLDPAGRGDGAPVPLGMILFLRDLATEPELIPVPVATAIRDVWALTFKLPTDESQTACFERVTDLVNGVDPLDLRRPLTMSHLPAVIDLVERHLAAG
jgi:hypothetical protein